MAKKKQKVVKIPKKSGRPSKYKPEYCEEIIKFFSGPKMKQVVKSERTITKANGTTETFKEYMYMAEDLPTFNQFARSIGVNEDTVVEWAKPENKKKYDGFSVSYNIAHKLQKEFLVDNALKGLHPPATFIFTAKNITDMRDKVETDIDVTSKGKRVVAFNFIAPKPDGHNTEHQANT